MSLDPLANPKGVKLLCELCQKPAYIQCTKCRVTYYCCVEHQNADWLGIHEKICQLLIPLRTPVPILNSQEERRHRDEQLLHRQKQMMELTRTTSQKLLFEGKHDQAIPAAMQSLRFAIQVHGLATIELVPSYLILGEASIGLGRLSQAEEYLSQAQWTVLKTPECSNSIKSKLYRNLGLLYAAKGEFSEALRSLADDVYHASEEFGTEDIRTSGGYFHMANVFYKQDNMDVALSLYDQVTSMWFEHLEKIVKVRTGRPATPQGVGPSAQENKEEEDGLDEAQEAEAIQVLSSINDVAQNNADVTPDLKVKVTLALAMLQFVLHEQDKAKEFVKLAHHLQETVDDEKLSTAVAEFVKIVS